ncbi:RNase P modulator RnpM [Sporomusa termitida]|nr:YlxR family protein [Sporomusa termitida]
MCVGCQEMKAKKELLRVVRSPEGEIVLDPTGKKAGRGAYMCRSQPCLAKAFKEKRLERALKQQISADVYNALRAGIIE